MGCLLQAEAAIWILVVLYNARAFFIHCRHFFSAPMRPRASVGRENAHIASLRQSSAEPVARSS